VIPGGAERYLARNLDKFDVEQMEKDVYRETEHYDASVYWEEYYACKQVNAW
jgi:hypothetical protein